MRTHPVAAAGCQPPSVRAEGERGDPGVLEPCDDLVVEEPRRRGEVVDVPQPARFLSLAPVARRSPVGAEGERGDRNGSRRRRRIRGTARPAGGRGGPGPRGVRFRRRFPSPASGRSPPKAKVSDRSLMAAQHDRVGARGRSRSNSRAVRSRLPVASQRLEPPSRAGRAEGHHLDGVVVGQDDGVGGRPAPGHAGPQSRAVWSSLPVASQRPSGLNARLFTVTAWSRTTGGAAGRSRSHSRAVLSCTCRRHRPPVRTEGDGE